MSDAIKDSITIDAQPPEVFRALTDAEALGHWMATRAESDPREGGSFRYVFEFEDPAQNNEQAGEYLAVEQGQRVALPWRFQFSDKQTTVEYRLEGEESGTKVEFAHSGFETGEPWDTARERFTGGWRMFLEGLKRYVEDGVDGHPLGMKSS
jgi:uncharacterized protein YndB with AHSA1/START domain